MADVTIVVTVLPQADGGIGWYFSTPLATILSDVITSVEMSLVTVADASCVFQSESLGQDPPLTFYTDWSMTEQLIPPPQWFKDLSDSGTSTITFNDDNTNQWDRTYYMRINAVFNGTTTNTHDRSFNGGRVIINGKPRDITSPDPTIINVGTDGPPQFLPLQETSEPAVTAGV
jgi:hypothetical protein